MGHGLTRLSRIFTDTSTPSQPVESVKIRVPRLARSSLAVEAEPQNNALPLGVTAMANDSAGVFRMILFPSLITLAVTVLRLIGELKHWPRTLFNPEPGGGGAIFGISWLAFVFAVYFAARVHKSQQPLEKAGKAIGITLLSLAFCIAGVFLMFRAIQSASLIAWAPSMAVVCGGLYLMRFAWPSYWAVMMAYALAARIPVIAVMYFAIKGNWGQPRRGRPDLHCRGLVDRVCPYRASSPALPLGSLHRRTLRTIRRHHRCRRKAPHGRSNDIRAPS